MPLRIAQINAVSRPAVLADTGPVPGPKATQQPNSRPAPPDGADPPDMRPEGAKVSQEAARYLTPDSRCQHCVHYMESAGAPECSIVAGPIDPMGSCSLFDADTDQDANEPEPTEPADDEE